MFEALFGSRTKELLILFIYCRGSGYAREIAKEMEISLTPAQQQLERLEEGGILVSQSIGKTRVYEFNPRWPFLQELKNLYQKYMDFLPEKDRDRLLLNRKRPRKKDKP